MLYPVCFFRIAIVHCQSHKLLVLSKNVALCSYSNLNTYLLIKIWYISFALYKNNTVFV